MLGISPAETPKYSLRTKVNRRSPGGRWGSRSRQLPKELAPRPSASRVQWWVAARRVSRPMGATGQGDSISSGSSLRVCPPSHNRCAGPWKGTQSCPAPPFGASTLRFIHPIMAAGLNPSSLRVRLEAAGAAGLQCLGGQVVTWGPQGHNTGPGWQTRLNPGLCFLGRQPRTPLEGCGRGRWFAECHSK